MGALVADARPPCRFRGRRDAGHGHRRGARSTWEETRSVNGAELDLVARNASGERADRRPLHPGDLPVGPAVLLRRAKFRGGPSAGLTGDYGVMRFCPLRH